MSNKDSPDLPVAAVFVENTEETYYSDIYFSEEGFNRVNTHDLQYFRDSDVHNVVECTRESDAEEAMQEARRSERQRILDKIEDKISDVKSDRDLVMNPDNKNQYTRVMNELKELRDDLKQDEQDEEEVKTSEQ